MDRNPNPLSILGNPIIAADLCIRKTLRFKEYSGPVIILDYTGRGALLLNRNNKMSIERRKVVWIDLADKRTPYVLLHFQDSDHFEDIIQRLLQILRKMSKIHILDQTIYWTVSIAKQLAKNGVVGLGSLLKTISSPEIRKLFLESWWA